MRGAFFMARRQGPDNRPIPQVFQLSRYLAAIGRQLLRKILPRMLMISPIKEV